MEETERLVEQRDARGLKNVYLVISRGKTGNLEAVEHRDYQMKKIKRGRETHEIKLIY